jgi:hypothetical protein
MRRVLLLTTIGLALGSATAASTADEPSSMRRPRYDATGVIVPRDPTTETPKPQGDFSEMRCPSQHVWREAGPNDHVCVLEHAHVRVGMENAAGPSHVNPEGGPYGPETCLPGFVWRDAFAGDHVCVTPDARRLASWENEEDRAQRGR